MELTPLSNKLLSDVSVEELEQRLEMAILAVPLESDGDIEACKQCDTCGSCNQNNT